MFRVPNLRAIKAWVISRIPTKISDLTDDIRIVTEDRIATTDKAGILKPDGTTLKVDDDGTAYASGAVSNDYRDFIHKPQINGVALEGDCSLDELGAAPSDLVGVSKDATGNTNIDYSYYDADTGSTKAKAGLDNLRDALEDSTTEIATNMQKLDEKIPVEPVNNLLATVPGTALDAVQGKVLNDKIANLGGFTPVIDETTGQITGYKTEIGGADTVFPFTKESNNKFALLNIVFSYKALGNNISLIFNDDDNEFFIDNGRTVYAQAYVTINHTGKYRVECYGDLTKYSYVTITLGGTKIKYLGEQYFEFEATEGKQLMIKGPGSVTSITDKAMVYEYLFLVYPVE